MPRYQLTTLNPKAKGKRIQGIAPSLIAEAQYRRAMFGMLKQMRLYLRETYLPAVRTIHSRYTRDAEVDDLAKANTEMTAYFASLVNATVAQIRTVLNLAGRQHTAAWTRAVRKAIGVDIAALVHHSDLTESIQRSAASAAELIKDISSTSARRIAQLALDYASGGKSVKAFVDDVQRVLKVSRNRAKVIARDQIAKANSSFSRIRQVEAGVTSYVWRTSQDERVRPTHRSNNGKKIRWDQPPVTTGHPGHDIMCRCTAEAVI